MTREYLSMITTFLFTLLFAAIAGAHCEIPCGIYDDEARLQEISEHITTVEKAMKTILELQKEKDINYNQLVRWIDNKEYHADAIQEVASQYFLTQRITFDAAEYDKKLAALHQIIVYAMKCKQTVDEKIVGNLREATATFEQLYLGKNK